MDKAQLLERIQQYANHLTDSRDTGDDDFAKPEEGLK